MRSSGPFSPSRGSSPKSVDPADDDVRSSNESTGSSGEVFLPSSQRGRLPGRVASSGNASPPLPSPRSQAFEPVEAQQAEAAPLQHLRPFTDIPIDVTKAFDILREVDSRTVDRYRKHKAQTANPDAAKAKKFLKEQAKAGTPANMTEQYQLLRGGRRAPSLCETLLPEKSNFRSMLFAPTGGIRDTRTGLYAELHVFDKGNGSSDYLLCFPGTGAAGNKDVQWNANLKQALGGGVPRNYLLALELATELEKVVGKGSLSVAGHSMGGGIANFVGLAMDIDSYCFNAAALGSKSLEYLKIGGALQPERILKQQHVRMKSDFVSGRTAMNLAGRLGGQASTPALAGVVYQCTPDVDGYPDDLGRLDRHGLFALDVPMALHKKAVRGKSPAATTTTATATTTTTKAVHSSRSPDVAATSSSEPGSDQDYFSADQGDDDEFFSIEDPGTGDTGSTPRALRNGGTNNNSDQ